MFKKSSKIILRAIGLRSKCCSEKIIYWHHDKAYCGGCNQWLIKNELAPAYIPSKRAPWKYNSKSD